MDYNFLAMETAAKKLAVVLSDKGVDVKVKTSRYQKEIKAVEVASSTPLEDLIPALSIKAKLSDLTSVEEKAISGKYKAKLLTFNAPFEGISSGSSVFILNTFTEKGSVKTKDLAPEKLGLTKSRYANTESFDKAVFEGIAKLKVASEIKAALNALYEDVVANKTEGDNVPLSDKSKKVLSIVKQQDKQAIGKDFGEILSLRWYVTQSFGKKYTSFYFSEISNEALVDFVVELKEKGKVIRRDVSAKFEKGAAPSIGAVAKNIDKVYVGVSSSREEKEAIDTLKALAGLSSTGRETTSMKILAAYKALDLPAYKKLKQIMKKKTGDLTIKEIQDYIQNIAKKYKTAKERKEAFKREFTPLYDLIGQTAKDSSMDTVFSTPSYNKYFSLLLSPMGYALVDYMNKKTIYQVVLNNISRELSTEQVYLNITSSSLSFKKKLFSNSSFQFEYGANAKDSDNTGIKFSMK